MKVYVLTTGSYSDYSIHSIYSEELLVKNELEKNKKLIEEGFSGEEFNDIEEYELNVVSLDPKKGFYVRMDEQGNTKVIYKKIITFDTGKICTVHEYNGSIYISGYVVADTEIEAIKIMNEKRFMAVARNEFEKERKRIVDNKIAYKQKLEKQQSDAQMFIVNGFKKSDSVEL